MGRNSFLTFLFALIPGAGQMYLGLMKKGICIMLGFGLISTLVHLAPFNFIGFILPVIWFYAFFDTLVVARLTPEERMLDEDDFMHKIKHFFNQDWKMLFAKYYVLIAVVVILLGVHTLFSNFILPFLYRFTRYSDWIYSFFYKIPNLCIGIILLVGGFYILIRNRTHKK